jgi:molybdate transport system substrate-binding protein
MRFLTGALAAGIVLLSAPGASAQNAAIRVLASNGVKGAMEELKPQCERAIGRPVALQFSSTAGLKKRIDAGEAFDVAILTTEATGDLTKAGKIAGASRAVLGRSELGIGIRAGAAKPDIRTAEALKHALQAAKSITYPQDGATRGFIEKMFERMGIAAEIHPKIILAPGSGPATESVAAGKAELVITLFSEIVPVPGVEILGPLPGEFEDHVTFEVSASIAAKDPAAAKALVSFLAGPKAAATFKAKGVERR